MATFPASFPRGWPEGKGYSLDVGDGSLNEWKEWDPQSPGACCQGCLCICGEELLSSLHQLLDNVRVSLLCCTEALEELRWTQIFAKVMSGNLIFAVLWLFWRQYFLFRDWLMTISITRQFEASKGPGLTEICNSSESFSMHKWVNDIGYNKGDISKHILHILWYPST